MESSLNPSLCFLSSVVASFSDRLSRHVELEMTPNNLQRRDGTPYNDFSKRHWLGHLSIWEAITMNREREHTTPARVTAPQPLQKAVEALAESH